MKQYFLAQDNDCHWWLVEAARREEWEAWVAIGPDDEAGWRPPDCATEVNSCPSRVVFSSPVMPATDL